MAELEIKQPQLYGADGKPISLSEEQIAGAVASGKAGFLKGTTIPVVAPDGTTGTIPAEEAPVAFGAGYKYEPLSSQQERALEEQYTSTGSQVRAGLEALARGATVGLSDPLMVAGGVDPEGIKERKQRNEDLATGMTIVGAAAPVILSKGAAAPGVAGTIARGGILAKTAALTPAAGVARVGEAVTAAIAPSVTRMLGTQGAKTLAARIAAGAIPAAAGGAVEGALFGAGNVLSEEAIGEPGPIGEKILANVGIGALFGAGVGAVFGGIGGAFKKADVETLVSETPPPAAPKIPMTEEELYLKYGNGSKPPQPGETLTGALDEMGVPAEKQADILKGLNEIKKNAPEIKQAAELIDAPVMESQISASKHVQDMDSMLAQSPTPTGVGRAQKFQQGFDRAEQVLGRSVGEGVDMSAAEIGTTLQGRLAAKFEAKAGPIKELYGVIDEYAPAIQISEKSTSRIGNNIRKIIEDEKLIAGSAERKFVEMIADGLDEVKDLAWLRKFRTNMSRSVTQENRFVAGLIKDKLDNLEQKAIKRFAGTMKRGVAKEKILGLIEQINGANSSYRAFREEMETMGAALFGKKRIYGPQHFLDLIEEMTPEKFAQKLYAKNNSKFLQWFNKQFPEETKLIMQYQRSAIRNAAMTDGKLQFGKVFKSYDNLSPELRSIMFTDTERKMIEAVRTYIDAMPKNINPSGTSKSEAYRRFFEGNFFGRLFDSTKDYGKLKAIENIVPKGSEDIAKAKLLARLEEVAQGTTKSIKSAAKAFVTGSNYTKAGTVVIPASVNYLNGTRLDHDKRDRTQKKREESFKKRYAEISNVVSNPQAMVDSISESLRGIRKSAPKISDSLTQTAVKASHFLYEKAPKNPRAHNALLPSVKQWHPSDADISKWERYVTAIDHPTSVLHDLKHGTLSREAVDALKTVYPSFHGELVSSITEELTNLKQDLPYQKRLQLSVLFGVPIDDATNPQFIAMMQGFHAQAQAQEQAKNRINMQGMHKSEMASRKQSDTERLLNRGA